MNSITVLSSLHRDLPIDTSDFTFWLLIRLCNTDALLGGGGVLAPCSPHIFTLCSLLLCIFQPCSFFIFSLLPFNFSLLPAPFINFPMFPDFPAPAPYNEIGQQSILPHSGAKDLGHFWLGYIRITPNSWDTCN